MYQVPCIEDLSGLKFPISLYIFFGYKFAQIDYRNRQTIYSFFFKFYYPADGITRVECRLKKAAVIYVLKIKSVHELQNY